MRKICAALAASLMVLVASPAVAQATPQYRPSLATGDANPMPTRSMCWTGSAWTPCPVSDPSAAATSTPQEATVTATTATATSGTASIASGVATMGPLVPQLGRGIRVVLRGTWTGKFQLGTSSLANGCATFNPLTVAGQEWGSFTANANEVVDVPTLLDVVYCGRAIVQSGSLSAGFRQ